MYMYEGKVKTWLRILYYQICIEKCFKLAVDIQCTCTCTDDDE